MRNGGTMQIRVDHPHRPEVAALLVAHLDHCRRSSPPESVHALDLDGLCTPDIVFWTACEGDAVLGCGALKELDSHHGEIKSMHTAARHRGRGVAAAVLAHMLNEARSRAYRRVSLETGSMDAFAPARALYARFGFVGCPPFGNYRVDPYSVCMTLELRAE
jgi:putative acetyltransferase